jgi:uncharacterized protein (DUF1501 family)
MERRTFIKALAAVGLVAGAPLVGDRSRAAGRFSGPFLVQVDAGGGWDPRFLFDPSSDAEQNRVTTESVEVGAFRCPALTVDAERLELDTEQGQEQFLLSPQDFLAKHASALAVVNGVDTGTNNHEAGNRAMWSGRTLEGYPSVGALHAAHFGSHLPVAYLSSGGYDATQNLVPLARVANVDALRRVISPNLIDANSKPEDRAYFHTQETFERIRRVQRERLASRIDKEELPRVKAALVALDQARAAEAELARLKLPTELVDLPGLDDLERFLRQAQIVVAAFASGVTAAATLSLGGFDTHSDHDRNQSRQLMKLLYGVDFLLAELDKAGLRGKTVVVASSDFARGPRYNGDGGNAGKDHWPTTSVFALGPGIRGGRVVGATTSEQLPALVDPKTLKVTSGGAKIEPHHVHRSLRQALGISDAKAAASFGLAGETLPLFA